MRNRLVLLFSLLFLIVLGVSTLTSTQAEKSSEKVEEKASSSDSLLSWMSDLKTKSQIHRDSGDIQMAVDFLTEAIDQRWREPQTDEEYEKLAWIFTNRAYLYNERQGDFLAAKEDYLSALKQFDKCQPSDYFVARYVYQPLGNIYTRLGENEIAISMLEKFKRACEDTEESEALMNAYNDIGRAFMNSGELEKSIELFRQGIEIDPSNLFSVGLLYSSKAEAEVKSEAFVESMKSARLSIACLDRVLAEVNEKDYHFDAARRYKIGVLATMAKVHSNMGEHSQAHENYQTSHDLAMEVYPHKHRAVARTFVELGNSWSVLNDGSKAMENYQLALNALMEGVVVKNYLSNPARNVLFADVVIGEALVQKAKVAYELFQKEKSGEWLEVSARAFTAYFDWVDVQRSEQFEFNSKLGAASEIHQTGELALRTYYDLYQQEKKKSWVDSAFALMDQTKAIVLAEERGFKELAKSNPKMRDLLKEQNALKFQRSLFKADIRKAEEDNRAYEVLRLMKRMSELDERSQLLEQKIRSIFPAYRLQANSRLEGETASRLKQKMAERNTQLLSYFVGNDWSYAILGEPENFRFVRIQGQTLKDEVLSFMSELNDPMGAKAEDFAREGKELFDVLIPTKISGKNWVILPDGMLNSLPFEALVSEDTKSSSFKKMNYLLKDHVIHYAPSAYFFAQDQFGEHAPESFLGVAPVFEHSSEYAYLPKSLEELQVGVDQFSGVEINRAEATKSRFFKEAEKYDILHISTHAGTNSGGNNDAWMVFSDENSKQHRLVANELLQLNLPASLVVLNACETGRGTIFQGEGPMSLARSFLDAGSQSTVTNLWSVSHESNSAIMQYFYEDLSENLSPSRALTHAKLKYLESGNIDDRSAHPFYWSSAILIGTDVSVSPPPSGSGWIWLLVGVLGLLSLSAIVYIKWKQKFA